MRTLDVAQGLEILIQLELVARTDDLFETFQLVAYEIENAAVALHPGKPHLGVGASARAEHPLEDRAWIVLDRQRCGGRPPGDRVGVGAACATVTVAEHRVRLDAELERGDLGLFRQLPRRDLVHGHRVRHIGAVGDLVGHTGQEGAGRPRVVSPALDQVGRLIIEPTADQHLVLERLQRPQGWWQLAERSFGRGIPIGHRHAVGHIKHTEACDRRRGGPALCGQCRHHAIEERQGQRGAETTQDGPARQVRLGDEHVRIPYGFGLSALGFGRSLRFLRGRPEGPCYRLLTTGRRQRLGRQARGASGTARS